MWMHGAKPEDFLYGFPALPGTGEVKVGTEQYREPCDPDRMNREVTPAEARAMHAAHVAGRLRAVDVGSVPLGRVPVHGDSGLEFHHRPAPHSGPGTRRLRLFRPRFQAFRRGGRSGGRARSAKGEAPWIWRRSGWRGSRVVHPVAFSFCRLSRFHANLTDCLRSLQGELEHGRKWILFPARGLGRAACPNSGAGGGAQQGADTLSAIRARGDLIVGVKNDYRPYGFVDPSGQIVGLEVDLAREVAQRIGVGLELVPVIASNRMEFLRQGRIDMILATMSDTADRRRVIGMIEPNYYADGVTVLAPKSAQSEVLGAAAGAARLRDTGRLLQPACGPALWAGTAGVSRRTRRAERLGRRQLHRLPVRPCLDRLDAGL